MFIMLSKIEIEEGIKYGRDHCKANVTKCFRPSSDHPYRVAPIRFDWTSQADLFGINSIFGSVTGLRSNYVIVTNVSSLHDREATCLSSLKNRK